MSLCAFLRIPPLFVMDKIFSISFGFQDLDGIMITLNNIFENSRLSQIVNDDLAQYYELILLLFIKIIVSCLSKFNKLSNKNNIITLLVNSVLIFFSSILFIVIYICSTCSILVPSVLTYCFYLCYTFFLLG